LFVFVKVALQRFKRLSSSTRSTNISASSLPKTSIVSNEDSAIAYERPWDTLQTSLINSLSSPPPHHLTNNRSNNSSLQNMPSTEELKQQSTPPFPLVSPTINSCRHSTCSPEDKINHHSTTPGGRKTD